MTIPKTFYKYRTFSDRVVEQLCEDQVYFADPSTFNDPMDSSPCVEDDVGVDELKRILSLLLRNRLLARMRGAATSIGYRGPRTKEHIERRAEASISETLSRLAYDATNPDYMEDVDVIHAGMLVSLIEKELLLQYDKGVLSLAKRNNCPLMWSHYAGQHTGLCVGYEMPTHLNSPPPAPQKVTYGGSRRVPASRIAEMLRGDEVAREFVDGRVLLTKAQDWRYEKEWRLLGARGSAFSTMELTEVIFGMRCPEPVRFSVAKTLEQRQPEVRFYAIQEVPGTFKLKRVRIFLGELEGCYPYRALERLEVAESFGPVEDV